MNLDERKSSTQSAFLWGMTAFMLFFSLLGISLWLRPDGSSSDPSSPHQIPGEEKAADKKREEPLAQRISKEETVSHVNGASDTAEITPSPREEKEMTLAGEERFVDDALMISNVSVSSSEGCQTGDSSCGEEWPGISAWAPESSSAVAEIKKKIGDLDEVMNGAESAARLLPEYSDSDLESMFSEIASHPDPLAIGGWMAALEMAETRQQAEAVVENLCKTSSKEFCSPVSARGFRLNPIVYIGRGI